MPLHQNQDGTWQWGKSGKRYKKKEDAVKQMKAIFANGYVEKKASCFKVFNIPSYSAVLGMIKKADQVTLTEERPTLYHFRGPVTKALDTDWKTALEYLTYKNKGIDFKKLRPGVTFRYDKPDFDRWKDKKYPAAISLINNTQHYYIPEGFTISKNWPQIANYTKDANKQAVLARLKQHNPNFNPNKLKAGARLNLGLPAETSFPSFDDTYEAIENLEGNEFIRTRSSGGVDPKTGKPLKYSAFGPTQITYDRLLAARNLNLSPEARKFLQEKLIPQAKRFLANTDPKDPIYGAGAPGEIDFKTVNNRVLFNQISKALVRQKYDEAVARATRSGSNRVFDYWMAKGWHGNEEDAQNWKYAEALRQYMQSKMAQAAKKARPTVVQPIKP